MKMIEHLLNHPAAFPTRIEESDGSTTQALGLSKREYIAAMAMQGILSNPALINLNISDSHIANSAVSYADDLLSALKVR